MTLVCVCVLTRAVPVLHVDDEFGCSLCPNKWSPADATVADNLVLCKRKNAAFRLVRMRRSSARALCTTQRSYVRNAVTAAAYAVIKLAFIAAYWFS
uniref:Uncharacterized protein n=1 Tax=Rhipicephalus appendiculatus TaxID=34631 RepID=A0A131YE67_RHIAP